MILRGFTYVRYVTVNCRWGWRESEREREEKERERVLVLYFVE